MQNTCLYCCTQTAGVIQKQQIGVSKNSVHVESESNLTYLGCFACGVPGCCYMSHFE